VFLQNNCLEQKVKGRISFITSFHVSLACPLITKLILLFRSSKSYLVGIPQDLAPSLPKCHSPLINIRYSVRITLKYKGTAGYYTVHIILLILFLGYNGKTKLKLPIFISDVFPKGITAPVRSHEHVGILRVFSSTCYHPPPVVEKVPEDANVWLQSSVFESVGGEIQQYFFSLTLILITLLVGLDHLKKLPIDVSTFTPPTVEKYIADPPQSFNLSKVIPVPHKKSMATIYHNPFSFADFRKPSTKMTVTIVDNNKSPELAHKDPTSASAPTSPKASPATEPFLGAPRRNSISTETLSSVHIVEGSSNGDAHPTSDGPRSVPPASENNTKSLVSLQSLSLPQINEASLLAQDRTKDLSPKKKKSRLSSPRKLTKSKHTRSKSESNWDSEKKKPVEAKM
jgi:hypothetical protein